MAFESLSDKFQGIIKKLKGQSRLTEANMDEMLGEIRVALLEADVNFKVVKEFTSKVKEGASSCSIVMASPAVNTNTLTCLSGKSTQPPFTLTSLGT